MALALGVLTLVVFPVSVWRRFWIPLPISHVLYVGLERGAITAVWCHDLDRRKLWANRTQVMVVEAPRDLSIQWRPEYLEFASPIRHWFSVVRLPLWLPAAVVTAATAWFWWRDRRFARPGLCPTCGYDRTGLAPDAVCPECGSGR